MYNLELCVSLNASESIRCQSDDSHVLIDGFQEHFGRFSRLWIIEGAECTDKLTCYLLEPRNFLEDSINHLESLTKDNIHDRESDSSTY